MELLPGHNDEIPTCGKAILAPEGMNWPMDDKHGKLLFIRGCYPEVFKKLLEFEELEKDSNSRGVVLTGNPGIGKVSIDVPCLWISGEFPLILKLCVFVCDS